jgi:hypothetical protein
MAKVIRRRGEREAIIQGTGEKLREIERKKEQKTEPNKMITEYTSVAQRLK